MSLEEYKITDGHIAQKGVVAAPDRLTGTAAQNKAIFDRLIREAVKSVFNGLIDALSNGGAGEIGVEAIEGVTGDNVQTILESLKILLDGKEGAAEAAAALLLKADKTETAQHIKSVSFNAQNGVFTFTKQNGQTVTIDTMLEKLAVNFQYDATTQELVLTLADGTTQRISLSAFITETEFVDSDQIDFSVSSHKVTATIKQGSITDAMLSSGLVTLLQGYVSSAAGSATNASTSAAAAAGSASAASGSAGAAAASAAAAQSAAYTAAADAAAQAAEQTAGQIRTEMQGYVSDAAASKNAAAASEQAAARSKNAAASSASAAASSQTAAAGSAGAAATSAGNAATSETNATNSATAAAASAAAAESAAQMAAQEAAEAAAQEAAEAVREEVAEDAQKAADSAEDSEAWAVGQRGGVDVPTTDETYHNNAKYWAAQAQQAAGGGVTSFNGRSGVVTPQIGDYTAEQVGAIPSTEKGAAGGVATLGADGKVPSSQLPALGFTPRIVVTAPTGSTVTCTKGSTVLTASEVSGAWTFDVPDYGTWTVNAVKGSKSASESVEVTEVKQYTLTLEFVPDDVDSASWATISAVSAAGLGDTYWDAGDCKKIRLNGNIGEYLTLSNKDVYVFILGFNHNSAKGETQGILWGGFKTAKTNGTLFALFDSKYSPDYDWESYTDGHKHFTMNHSQNTNAGGWKGCDFRYDILGACSSKGADATTATRSNPPSNTLAAALPADLRSVLKLRTHYVDNTGNSSNVAANVTAVVDLISLMAEFEIFGTQTWANQYEKDKQAQFAYFAAGNAHKWVKETAASTGLYVWEASPCYNIATAFCRVRDTGDANPEHAYCSLALAAAFLT